MAKNKNYNRQWYNLYGFDSKTPILIPLKQVIDVEVDMNAIKDAVKEGIAESDIDNNNCDCHKHIHCATEKIINEIHKNKQCMCNIATKQDIKNAVEAINNHTDEKFDEVDFAKHFDDLNQQIMNLKN